MARNKRHRLFWPFSIHATASKFLCLNSAKILTRLIKLRYPKTDHLDSLIMKFSAHAFAARCSAQRPERVRVIAEIVNSAITEMQVGSEATRN